MQGQARTLARLSPYFVQGNSDSLQEIGERPFLFPDGCQAVTVEGKRNFKMTAKEIKGRSGFYALRKFSACRFLTAAFCFSALTQTALFAGGEDASIKSGVRELNAGRLTAAKAIFQAISTNSTPLESAIAHKHLGTVRFRLGEKSYRADFEAAEKLLQGLPDHGGTEYGKVLYQKANCILSDFENVLVEKRIQGVPAIPFSLIRDYVHPASKAIDKAAEHYPKDEIYDIDLIRIDMALAEARLWLISKQGQTACGAYRKAFAIASEDKAKKGVPPDALKKILLRYATVLLECSKDELKSWKVEEDALTLLRRADKIESGNSELDYAIRAFYLRQVLHSPDFKPTDESFRKEIMALSDAIEQLNLGSAADLDYVGLKSYFSMRTAAYEVLMEYYAARNMPFEMLLAMNKMRSRALQSTLGSNAGNLSESQLKEGLKRDNSLLVSFFVGADAVWMVGFSQKGGEILRSNKSGREIVALSQKVVQTFSSATRLFMYRRSGAKAVPEAYAHSHELYKELFLKWHDKFKAESAGKIILMPNHYLNYLPFSALVTELDSENVFHSRYVAHEGIPICYMPALPDYGNANSVAHDEKRSLVLARGDYTKPAYYYNNDVHDPDKPTGEPLPLPGAIKEGKEVASLLHASEEDVLLEDAASEFNLFKKTATPVGVVHIASHAHLVSSDPLASYVVLSAGEGEDGKVTVAELFNRYKSKLNANLLTLSACNTNRGEDNIRPGDDIAALSSAFLVAGAKSVIATQWPASDEAFPQIMTSFYTNYISGKKTEDALAEGVKSYLAENRDSVRIFPLFWGNVAALRSVF